MKDWLDGYYKDTCRMLEDGNILNVSEHMVNIDELIRAYQHINEVVDHDDSMFDPDLEMLERYEKELGEYGRRD